MAGSVARGSYVEPALVTSPAVHGGDRTPKPLQAKATGELRTLMREVVTSGTGSVLKGVPGGPVSGKTGTAEHGSKTPPETRAWFVGWQGDVAFAVLVEEGRSGGAVAAPLAKAFLADLRR
jgi:cell division protein FtsI/penicillin-binding protein 2